MTRFVGSRRATVGIGRYRKEELLLVKQLVEAGKYRPVIDRTYALDDVIEATRYVESGQKTGNVVLRMGGAEPGGQPARRARRTCRPRHRRAPQGSQPSRYAVRSSGPKPA